MLKIDTHFHIMSLLSSFSPKSLQIEFYVTHWVSINIIDASFFLYPYPVAGKNLPLWFY